MSHTPIKATPAPTQRSGEVESLLQDFRWLQKIGREGGRECLAKNIDARSVLRIATEAIASLEGSVPSRSAEEVVVRDEAMAAALNIFDLLHGDPVTEKVKAAAIIQQAMDAHGENIAWPLEKELLKVREALVAYQDYDLSKGTCRRIYRREAQKLAAHALAAQPKGTPAEGAE